MSKRIFVDDDHLAWVKLRASGHSPNTIGTQYDVSPDYIRAATNKIKNADLAESGEDTSVIRGCYW